MESGHAAAAAALSLGTQERWAHPIAHPERGCLLVARRPGLGMFSHTVILVLEHEDGQGSSGLVLNMPTPMLISHLGLEEEIVGESARAGGGGVGWAGEGGKCVFVWEWGVCV